MNTEEKLQVLAALLEENCSAVRIKDGCMLFQGKKSAVWYPAAENDLS